MYHCSVCATSMLLHCPRRDIHHCTLCRDRRLTCSAVCLTSPHLHDALLLFFSSGFSRHVGSPVRLMIFLSPHRPVRLLARSQSSTLQISFACVFPSCFRSSSLPFPWYICPHHFPQYVLPISPHHMPVPDQSSLGDLFGSLRHSCCSSDVFIPDLVFACHFAHPYARCIFAKAYILHHVSEETVTCS